MLKVNDIFKDNLEISTLSLKEQLNDYYAINEAAFIKTLADLLKQESSDLNEEIYNNSHDWVEQIRKKSSKKFDLKIESFLQEYSLSTKEGVALMCLAEALLRIPDEETINALINDKLASTNWQNHLKKSDSFFVNASTWGLFLTGKVLKGGTFINDKPENVLQGMVGRLSEPVVRRAINIAMKLIAKQFVLGASIDEALKISVDNLAKNYTHSYDMLGEAALQADDVTKYFESYKNAITQVAAAVKKNKTYQEANYPSISIKLSALHPRYDEMNRTRVLEELTNTVLQLILYAKSFNLPITIDAEEADRLDLSLDIFEKFYTHKQLKGWGKFGLAVQAYSKRILPLLAWINKLAADNKTPIPVRLVKGAYWDYEIKHSQTFGLADYPVFTKKANTDISYLCCVIYLLKHAQNNIYPQFATHNIQTLNFILSFSKKIQATNFEFQLLHGMGTDSYDLLTEKEPSILKRIYAPVGAHKELLPYLIRRLLENGANTSFVHSLVDKEVAIDDLIKHPLDSLEDLTSSDNKIPLPADIFRKSNNRLNSEGENLNIRPYYAKFAADVFRNKKPYDVTALINSKAVTTKTISSVICPFNEEIIGTSSQLGKAELQNAFSVAAAGFANNNTTVEFRAQCLEKLADLLETNKGALTYLLIYEGGKIMQDAIDEIREAVDFCRYYAAIKLDKYQSRIMPSITGEENTLHYEGRGVFLCISPWNFPLAIFLGQVAAAFVTGNSVLAKPATNTTLVAHFAIKLAFEAGVPKSLLQFIPAPGKLVSSCIVNNKDLAGICFTGSEATAFQINQTLALRKKAPIVPFIAETGGLNAMIVDSTCLPEQVTKDAIRSAFLSAGQRCSALRAMFIQDEIYDNLKTILIGATQELKVGAADVYQNDLSAVIDKNAQNNLNKYLDINKENISYQQENLPEKGFFVKPSILEISSLKDLKEEQFGPILHLIRFDKNKLDQVIEDINASGYGLTLAVHSRNESLTRHVAKKAQVGNIYINRDQVGAVVESQSFGGYKLSGTGPKAGGPNYLMRFMVEKTVSNNLSAIGGNIDLFNT